jgi:glycerophosphoryl diester phosphodiesterase
MLGFSILLAVASVAVALLEGGDYGCTGASCPRQHAFKSIQLGPRPYYLVNDMDNGPLKEKLASCSEMTFKPSKFSIGHRGGGTLQFPEHTVESNLAGARMGAGILECDVTFTKDKKLVCRHDQCDLHTSTNIVNTPLNAKCTTPFTPAGDGKPATAKCCTSDITLAEFKTLCGKMDASNPNATTAKEFLENTPNFRTDLYSTCGTLMTHAEHIELINSLGLDFAPELKTPVVKMPFNGYTQENFAQDIIDDYKATGIAPSRVWPQSFLYDDILYLLKKEPAFGAQAVFLDESADDPADFPAAVKNLTKYAKDGVKIVAPPTTYLVEEKDGKIVPSAYATTAKKNGLGIITWTLERSGFLGDGSHGGYYYTSIANATNNDGDAFNLLHVLAKEVGVLGVFSDWAATTTYYANCFNI